jgi:hypothetical protein
MERGLQRYWWRHKNEAGKRARLYDLPLNRKRAYWHHAPCCALQHHLDNKTCGNKERRHPDCGVWAEENFKHYINPTRVWPVYVNHSPWVSSKYYPTPIPKHQPSNTSRTLRMSANKPVILAIHPASSTGLLSATNSLSTPSSPFHVLRVLILPLVDHLLAESQLHESVIRLQHGVHLWHHADHATHLHGFDVAQLYASHPPYERLL